MTRMEQGLLTTALLAIEFQISVSMVKACALALVASLVKGRERNRLLMRLPEDTSCPRLRIYSEHEELTKGK